MSADLYYVAVFGGFLVVEDCEEGRASKTRMHRKTYAIADVRSATSWDSFSEADAFARSAVLAMYPPDLRYYAILVPSFKLEQT